MTDFWRAALDPERVIQMPITHWHEDQMQQREDYLTVEEPFEVRIDHQSLAVIMRTPGHDAELAAGFLLAEGIIDHTQDIIGLEQELDQDGLPEPNVMNVMLAKAYVQKSQRNFSISSSCGVCGKNSIADLLCTLPPLAKDTLRIPIAVLYALAEKLRKEQAVFRHTGSLHAAALFSQAGELLLLREDVGRHNAVDKLIGQGVLNGTLPYEKHILLVSGRTSFEIIQKAVMARIPCIAAISAPSSMAVELAARAGITLIGFLRGHSFNIYTHAERII